MLRSMGLAVLWSTLVCPAGVGATERERDGSQSPAWALDLTTTAYLLPDEPDYLQPSVTADRGSLRLEGRYAVVDRETFSLFMGWSVTMGEAHTLRVTPMAGVVAGRTRGIAPGLELTLSWAPVEVYSESQYVLAFGGAGPSFFSSWSALGVRPTGWLRVGVVVQRTRRFRAAREVSLGPMISVAMGRFEVAFQVLDGRNAPPFAAVSVSLSL